MNYTPGPWTVEVDHASNTAEFVRAHLNGEAFDVASVLCDETGNATENARLIAAAPDLLAALESLNAAVIRAGYGNTAMPELTQAWAAIAKATGEA